MLPQIADEGLADYIDVFCDRGFFSADETSRILDAGLNMACALRYMPMSWTTQVVSRQE
jgi:imidazolonepropionase-like amidohydrolase